MLRRVTRLLASSLGTTRDDWRLCLAAPVVPWMRGGVESLLTIGVVCLLCNRSLQHLDGVQRFPLNWGIPCDQKCGEVGSYCQQVINKIGKVVVGVTKRSGVIRKGGGCSPARADAAEPTVRAELAVVARLHPGARPGSIGV